MITYRTFRNWDPPALVDLWNTSVSGRGVARDIELRDLDSLIFSKPYFDPHGLILAEQGTTVVGFVHAGFGASSEEMGISYDFGVIAMLMVHPDFRRRGIGRELVRRAMKYLRSAGSTVIYAGSIHPLDPFYLGLYGGSELPGVLRSLKLAHHLFQSTGFRPIDECVVYQRSLERPFVLVDHQARAWQRQTEFAVDPQPPPPNWWSACRYSCMELTSFQLLLRGTDEAVAHALGWEIYPLEKSWGADAVGIVEVSVVPEMRRRGLGTLLLSNILRHYRGSGLPVAEVQTMERNTAARKLYRKLGFEEIDRGVVYRADAAPAPGESGAAD